MEDQSVFLFYYKILKGEKYGRQEHMGLFIKATWK